MRKVKQFALMSALMSALAFALAGVASAQTVPAEAWAGPPIPTTGGQLGRGEVAADMQRAMTQPQVAPQHWVGSLAAAGIAVGALKRSEVMADYNLFARAGLSEHYLRRDAFEPYSREMWSRIGLYLRLRGGPEYGVEVARLEGTTIPQASSANGADASAD